MSITRTVELDDITSDELATLFCDMDNNQQANFFHRIHLIARNWPNSGWCGQACSIAEKLTSDGRECIRKLAEHAFEVDLLNRPASVGE